LKLRNNTRPPEKADPYHFGQCRIEGSGTYFIATACQLSDQVDAIDLLFGCMVKDMKFYETEVDLSKQEGLTS
jgi:hypothetical protein